MKKKAVFFDADGTVCDIEKGVPQSARDAIETLVKNGHEAWLCTGRSRAFVPDYLEQVPFTGMISALSGGKAVGGNFKKIRFGAGDGRRRLYVL